jgi:microcystin-dependent protein
MSSPFLAEIKMFGGNFAPTGYALCNGQLLPITQNTALFSLLGTFYGGDGKSTFALPNLGDSTALSQGTSNTGTTYDVGETSGTPFVTLLSSEMPAHTHNFGGSGTAGDLPVGAPDRVLAQSSPGQAYQTTTNANLTQFNPLLLSLAGSGLPHNNMMPFLAVTFIIAMQGLFPPRS